MFCCAKTNKELVDAVNHDEFCPESRNQWLRISLSISFFLVILFSNILVNFIALLFFFFVVVLKKKYDDALVSLLSLVQLSLCLVLIFFRKIEIFYWLGLFPSELIYKYLCQLCDSTKYIKIILPLCMAAVFWVKGKKITSALFGGGALLPMVYIIPLLLVLHESKMQKKYLLLLAVWGIEFTIMDKMLLSLPPYVQFLDCAIILFCCLNFICAGALKCRK